MSKPSAYIDAQRRGSSIPTFAIWARASYVQVCPAPPPRSSPKSAAIVPSYGRPSVLSPVRPSACLSVFLSLCMSVCLSVRLSLSMYVHLSVCVSIYNNFHAKPYADHRMIYGHIEIVVTSIAVNDFSSFLTINRTAVVCFTWRLDTLKHRQCNL